ncbi:hypothetical protein [Nocardia vaccinii]|uniref:hypothetical protein n=1 Tax=Nocardia vaccinii TaxID=1822 RepID=UPI00082C4213|nr:hypothetical protein [Nocardia vaccinii]
MSQPEKDTECGDELDKQLRLFCYLMLGSADAANHMMRQIHRHALEHRGAQQNQQSERARLFDIAAELSGARHCSSY